MMAKTIIGTKSYTGSSTLFRFTIYRVLYGGIGKNRFKVSIHSDMDHSVLPLSGLVSCFYKSVQIIVNRCTACNAVLSPPIHGLGIDSNRALSLLPALLPGCKVSTDLLYTSSEWMSVSGGAIISALVICKRDRPFPGPSWQLPVNS